MGYLTVVVLHIDAMGEFEKNPTKFGEAILDGMRRANSSMKEESVPIGSYCNYIHVHPLHHADDERLYLSRGNCVTDISAYNEGFQHLVKYLPKVAEEFLKSARFILKDAAKYFKMNKSK
jgi:hypothetical protein